MKTQKYTPLFAFLFAFTLFQSVLFANQPSITLTQRQLCDLELLMNGGFSPLEGFMDEKAYNSVVENMRLPDGSVWPIPIILDIDAKEKDHIEIGGELALRDPEGVILAILLINDIWKPNKTREAEKVYGTANQEHPGVDYLFNQTKDYYVGGKLAKKSLPRHYDFTHLRKTPNELKSFFASKGIDKVVAFQTRNPMHRAHLELTQRAAKSVGGHLLLHPAVGMTKPGDVDHFTRVKCYQKLIEKYPEGSATLSLLPISMRMAGPREALWHAIIRRNYGCTHFIVGRDHAGPGKDSLGKDFYGPYDAQNLVLAYANEIGIQAVPFKEMVYVKEDDNYQPVDEASTDKTILTISGTQLRKMLREGKEVPAWFSYPEVIAELRAVYPPRAKQGFTIFFTGLSGAGKSTIANILATKLMEIQKRPITLLDGDLIRKHLSSELGFSKEHRSLNIRRVGYVASEITKNGGAAICALIAPYETDRKYVKDLISDKGGFVEVYVATPLNICEERDVKGLYSQARMGKLKGFTGLDDPYEMPKKADLVIDDKITAYEAAEKILQHLREQGFIE